MNGKFIQEKVLDMLLKTEDPSFSSQKEPETLDSGIIIYQHNYRKLKAQRLRWTTAWRRLHKKIKQSDQGKLKKKKALKLERAIEGVSL